MSEARKPEFVEIPSYNEGDTPGTFILEERMVYNSAIIGLVIVPAGFVSDFASIPRWATWLHPTNGRHIKAAVVHDYLVRQPSIKRKTADQVFNEAMKVCNVKKWRRRQMYLAVRIGGIFGKNRHES